MHYDEKYFQWQRNIGELGGRINLSKFSSYIPENATVLDFGCGGGFLLHNIRCARRIGVEINPSARANAHELGIETYACPEEVPAGVVDVMVSNHALEHVPSPLAMIRSLRRVLKPDATVVFVVPHDCYRQAWVGNDINMHLFTWNPMTLGNLFATAGYSISSVSVLRHRWPPHYDRLYRLLGPSLFDKLCRLESYRTRNYQIKIVARAGAQPSA